MAAGAATVGAGFLAKGLPAFGQGTGDSLTGGDIAILRLLAAAEQGGTSLYPTLAQKVTSLEVLRILLSIGPSETMHFQTWQDKAGNAPALTDTDTGFLGSTGATVTFVDLSTNQPETLQANLIMPEPCDFLSKSLPQCAIIRPTSTPNSGAVAAINGFAADGLFIGQSQEFLQFVMELAQAADAATRQV